MFNMNSGYTGYSMSNRASEAYENGEKPISKWTKKDIIEEVKDYVAENKVSFSMSVLEKAPKDVLVELILSYSSWHHTSSYVNATDFYAIDLDKIKELTDKKIKDSIAEYKTEKVKKKEKPLTNIYKGTIKYLEWSGTRNHPKATECEMKNVNIEEKGCFYIVTNDNGRVLLRKKIDSKGTYVIKD